MTRDDVIARLKSVEPELRDRGVAALYLFGSFARGEATDASDVDVFVEPASDNFYALANFTGAYDVISRALPGREIGYGTRAGLSPYVRDAVESDAVRVF
ncbi:DNA processing protein DprA [Rhodoplanes elegans]|uniref:DNA processing protein DprA n=1 Tax=Rhodoplanes elegans TaxID=29408 RepID=A0A327KB39_9BRAD|nr:nucleotidyltransferase domain-containing protein [Rhodoplanes elegans]MBK5957660.1 DNA processing protein DprA [Rhodoplanes elegans]RAI35166.1 DNA processing protein DprA [Rhodoplanes elegans]